MAIYSIWTRLALTFFIFCISFEMMFQLTAASSFTFCSQGTSFTFSTEACPGGVLLKRHLNIDEACHCFESDLKMYSQCGIGRQIKKLSTFSGCKMPLITSGVKWDGRAMLLIPVDFNSSDKVENEPCNKMPENCVERNGTVVVSKPENLEKLFPSPTKPKENQGDEEYSNSDESDEESSSSEEGSSTSGPTKSIQPPPANTEAGQGDKIIVSVNPKNKKLIKNPKVEKQNSYNVNNRGLISGQDLSSDHEAPTVAPSYNDTSYVKPIEATRSTPEKNIGRKVVETVDEQPGSNTALQRNKAVLRHVTEVKAGRVSNPSPNTMTFKMIKQSVQIAARIIPNKLIKDINLEEAYLAFSYLFSKIDEDRKTDKNLNRDDYNNIMLALENCYNNVFELSFKTSGRPRQIKEFYLLNEFGYTVIEPQLPNDRAHQAGVEDYIVGIIWKVIDLTHAACFTEFQRNSPSTQFDYLISIENVFQRPEVQQRWYQPQLEDSKSKILFDVISHPNIKIFMNNLDKIDAAVHKVSGYADFLKKPKAVVKNLSANSGVSSRSMSSIEPFLSEDHLAKIPIKRSPELSPHLTASTEMLNASYNDEVSVTKHRNKRETVKQHDPSVFEIWEGRAYCLQKVDLELPASISNSVPNIQTLCKLISRESGKG